MTVGTFIKNKRKENKEKYSSHNFYLFALFFLGVCMMLV